MILEFGCLDAACADKESYRSCMKVLASLLKPGETIANCTTNYIPQSEMQSYSNFRGPYLNYEYVTSVLREDGFV